MSFFAAIKNFFRKIRDLITGHRYDSQFADLERRFSKMVAEVEQKYGSGSDVNTDISTDTQQKTAAEDTAGGERNYIDLGDLPSQSGSEHNTTKGQEKLSVKEQINGNLNKLNSMDAVATIRENETFKNKQEAKQWVLDKLENIENKVTREKFGEIIFDKKRISNGMRYLSTREEILAFAVVPQVLKEGVEIGAHPRHKGRDYDTVTFAAPVIINGQRGNLAVVVRREGFNYYKVHRIVTPDGTRFDLNKKRDIAERAGGVETDSGLSPADNVSIDSIPNSNENVNKNAKANLDEKSFHSLDDYADDDSYERVLKRKNNALQEETEGQIAAIHKMFLNGDITESEMLAAENDVMKNLFKKVNRQTHNYVRILRDRNNQRAAAKKTRGEVKGELRSEMTETERKRVLRESIRRRADSFNKRFAANTNTRNIPENLKPVTQAFVKLVYANNFEKDNLNNRKVIVN